MGRRGTLGEDIFSWIETSNGQEEDRMQQLVAHRGYESKE